MKLTLPLFAAIALHIVIAIPVPSDNPCAGECQMCYVVLQMLTIVMTCCKYRVTPYTESCCHQYGELQLHYCIGSRYQQLRIKETILIDGKLQQNLHSG